MTPLFNAPHAAVLRPRGTPAAVTGARHSLLRLRTADTAVRILH